MVIPEVLKLAIGDGDVFANQSERDVVVIRKARESREAGRLKVPSTLVLGSNRSASH